MPNKIFLSVILVFISLALSAQDLLLLYEETNKLEVKSMPQEVAEAVFISNSGELKITSSNKSLDNFSEPIKIDEGKYRYVVHLHLSDGHNVRHFYIQKKGSPFKTATKQKIFFRSGEVHYFVVTDPDVKFTLGKEKNAYHLVEGESCIEISSSLPGLQLTTNGQLPCKQTSSVTEAGTFVYTLVVNQKRLDSLRNTYVDFPDQIDEISTIRVYISNSNVAYINLEGLSQRMKWRYSVLPIQLDGTKASSVSTLHVKTNIAKAILIFNGQEYTTENGDFILQSVPGTYDVKVVADGNKDLFYEDRIQVLPDKIYQEFACPIKMKSSYVINYRLEKDATLLLDGVVVKKNKHHRIKVLSGIHQLEAFWNKDRSLNIQVQVDGWEDDVSADMSLAGTLSFSHPNNATFEIVPHENAMSPSSKKIITGEKVSLLGSYDVCIKKKGYYIRHYTFNIGVRDSVVGFEAVLNCKADELYRQYKYDKAYKAYQKMSSDWNDDHVKYQLGECLYYGYGVEQNRISAVNLWKEAAELGNMKAVMRLIEEDLPAVDKKTYLILAAENGVPEAQKQLADLFLYNSKLKNYEQALFWYRKACQNVPSAYYNIGYIYENALGVTKNVSVAKLQYELGSKAGDEQCSERVADYLYDESKIDEAIAMYAKLKNPRALTCYRMASAYYQDSLFVAAAQWLLKINTGELPHTEEYGRFFCLVANHIYGMDKKMSINLYEIAVDILDYNKFPKAYFRIGHYYEKTNPRRAYNYLTKSAALGDAEAMCRVGYCYETGIGVLIDYQQAFHWYNESVKHNYQKAYRYLGTLYINGDGVVKDEKLAVKYWTLAANVGDNAAVKLLIQYYKMKRQFQKASEWQKKLK